METNHFSSKEYFKILSIIHFVLVMAVVLFGLVVTLFIADFEKPTVPSDLSTILFYVVPAFVVIVAIIGSPYFFYRRLKPFIGTADLKIKLIAYRESFVIRFVLLQGTALFALVALLVSSDVNNLVYAGFIVILMILKRPTLRSVVVDLQLNQLEKSIMENPDSTF